VVPDKQPVERERPKRKTANREELQGVLRQALQQGSKSALESPVKQVHPDSLKEEEKKDQPVGRQGVLEPGQTVYFDR